MSSKTKRPSGGSTNTYSSNRKRHIRDLSVSSQDDHPKEKKASEENHDSDKDDETDGTKKNDNEKEKSPSELKRAKGDDSPDQQEESEEEKEYEVETIKRHRYQGKHVQYLVGWKGYPSEDDSWEPPKHLTGAHELLKKYRIEHNLDSKPKSGRASSASATKPSSKKSEKDPDLNEASDEEDDRVSRKRKRLSKDQPKSTIAPLRKNGIHGPTKADRESVANRKSARRDSDASEDDIESIDEDKWHARHKGLNSWEDLIRSVRTIEKPGFEDDVEKSPSTTSNSINVCLLWKTGKTTWVSNKTARAKLPQKLLDFYEAHLQFSTTEH